MRNQFLIIVLTFFTMAANAHIEHNNSQNSDLNIKMLDHSIFSISFDDNPFERTRSFNLRNVCPGYYHARIIKKIPNPKGNGFFVKTIYDGPISIASKRKVMVRVEERDNLRYRFFPKTPGKFKHRRCVTKTNVCYQRDYQR